MQSKIGRLRLVAFVEGVSFLLIIFVTMPLKYFAEWKLGNKIMGYLHGVLFIVYILQVVLIGITERWPIKTIFWALVASVVPFGTFYLDHKVLKPMQEEAQAN